MKSMRLGISALAVTALLVGGAVVVGPVIASENVAIPTTPAEHSAEAARYEQEVKDLQAKADRHASLVAGYKARGGSGGKQATALRSLASHCEDLEKAYRKAADAASEMAKAHREMAAQG